MKNNSVGIDLYELLCGNTRARGPKDIKEDQRDGLGDDQLGGESGLGEGQSREEERFRAKGKGRDNMELCLKTWERNMLL